MAKVQVLKDDKGRPAFAVVPWKEYQALTSGAAEDAALVKLGEAAAGDATLPAAAVRRIVVGGESAVKVVRELRGLSQRQLAERTESSAAYVSQIEAGRPAGRAMLSKLARVLEVPIDVLIKD